MEIKLNEVTLREYFPLIVAIFAHLDILIQNSSIENRQRINMSFLMNKFSARELANGMLIITTWADGFILDSYDFVKSKPNSKWVNLHKIIKGKISEFSPTQTGKTELILNKKTGQVSRKIDGHADLIVDFSNDGIKIKMLVHLSKKGDCVSTESLRYHTGAKSLKSLSNEKGEINKSLSTGLQLPHDQNAIESKPRVGYWINPLYRIIVV